MQVGETMSVAVFHRFWDNRSRFFKVLILVMIMVPLGVYNLVGASLIVNDNIDSEKSKVNTAETLETDNPDPLEYEMLNPTTDATLFSVDTEY